MSDDQPAEARKSSQKSIPEVLSAVTASYYGEAVLAGSRARARAQSAQSVATAFAATILSVLSIAIRHESLVARGLAAIAIVAWSVASILFMFAVGSPVVIDETIQGTDSPQAFVAIVLERARQERKQVDARQRLANSSIIVALLFSFISFVLIVFPTPEPRMTGWVVPSADQQKILQALCQSKATSSIVYGNVSSEKNDLSAYDFRVDRSICSGRTTSLQLTQAQVEGLVLKK